MDYRQVSGTFVSGFAHQYIDAGHVGHAGQAHDEDDHDDHDED